MNTTSEQISTLTLAKTDGVTPALNSKPRGGTNDVREIGEREGVREKERRDLLHH